MGTEFNDVPFAFFLKLAFKELCLTFSLLYPGNEKLTYDKYSNTIYEMNKG